MIMTFRKRKKSKKKIIQLLDLSGSEKWTLHLFIPTWLQDLDKKSFNSLVNATIVLPYLCHIQSQRDQSLLIIKRKVTIIRNTARDFRGDFYSPQPWFLPEPKT